MLPGRHRVDLPRTFCFSAPQFGDKVREKVAPYNRPLHPLNKTLILETTSKATRASKKSTQPITQHAEASRQVESTSTHKVIKTALIASYGWPTAEMQPSKRPATRR